MTARVLAAATVALLVAAPARGESRAEVRALAQAAQSDSAALARLRAVTSVDGRPMNLAAALNTTDPRILRSRLHLIAHSGPPVESANARASARSILGERRFRGSAVPRPFHGALVWLGKRFRPIRHAVHWLGPHVPGGDWTIWSLLAGIVVVACAVAAGRTASRRGSQLLGTGERLRLGESVDPAELDRRADAAEQAGDNEAAVRLRYQAGLIRLGRARVIPLRTSLTTGEARRLIASHEFNALARTHDEVAFGGRLAVAADAEAARKRWPLVLSAKGVRA